MKKQKRRIGFLCIGVLLASSCQGKKPCESAKVTRESEHELYGNNDTSSLCDPEESPQLLHRVESATDVSDVKAAEEPSTVSNEKESGLEEAQDVVILEAVSPVEISP